MDDDKYNSSAPMFITEEDDKVVYILNEGNFMYGNSSLSIYDKEKLKCENNVFYRNNKVPLGDVAHSMAFFNDKIFIVINNSGKIIVVDSRNYIQKAVIEGLQSPRYIHFINNNKAYVSDLYARAISIVNPNTFKVTGKIDLSVGNSKFKQHSSEQIIEYNNRIFVNCWSFDNKILVINGETDKIIDSIEVVKQPSSMIIDCDGILWVLSDGGIESSSYGSEKPAITKISTSNLQILKTIRFSDSDSPKELKTNSTKDSIYFINKDIFKMSVKSDSLPEKAFITAGKRNFYSLYIEKTSDELYVGDAIDYVQEALIYRYSSNGKQLDSFKAGVNPGWIGEKN